MSRAGRQGARALCFAQIRQGGQTKLALRSRRWLDMEMCLVEID